LRQRYGRYFTIGRGSPRRSGKPAIMGAPRVHASRRVVMAFALARDGRT
jgi:hypothetical protein